MTTYDSIWHEEYIDIIEVHVKHVRLEHVDRIVRQHTKILKIFQSNFFSQS